MQEMIDGFTVSTWSNKFIIMDNKYYEIKLISRAD